MKFRSILLCSAIVAATSISLSAFADETPPAEKPNPRVEDHMSKFQKYFRIHSSRQHKAEEQAEEEFERMKEEKRIAAARSAAKENARKVEEKTADSDSLLSDKSTSQPTPNTMANANPES